MTVKKTISIKPYDFTHTDNDSILIATGIQIMDNWKTIFPKGDIVENDMQYLPFLGKNTELSYQHVFYGEELIGYFGFIYDTLSIKIAEFYLKPKYSTATYFKAVLAFVNTLGKEKSIPYLSIEVFALQKEVTKLKLLKLKSATVFMYTEVQ